jgi:hypothetical protein
MALILEEIKRRAIFQQEQAYQRQQANINYHNSRKNLKHIPQIIEDKQTYTEPIVTRNITSFIPTTQEDRVKALLDLPSLPLKKKDPLNYRSTGDSANQVGNLGNLGNLGNPVNLGNPGSPGNQRSPYLGNLASPGNQRSPYLGNLASPGNQRSPYLASPGNQRSPYLASPGNQRSPYFNQPDFSDLSDLNNSSFNRDDYHDANDAEAPQIPYESEPDQEDLIVPKVRDLLVELKIDVNSVLDKYYQGDQPGSLTNDQLAHLWRLVSNTHQRALSHFSDPDYSDYDHPWRGGTIEEYVTWEDGFREYLFQKNEEQNESKNDLDREIQQLHPNIKVDTRIKLKQLIRTFDLYLDSTFKSFIHACDLFSEKLTKYEDLFKNQAFKDALHDQFLRTIENHDYNTYSANATRNHTPTLDTVRKTWRNNQVVGAFDYIVVSTARSSLSIYIQEEHYEPLANYQFAIGFTNLMQAFHQITELDDENDEDLIVEHLRGKYRNMFEQIASFDLDIITKVYSRINKVDELFRVLV